MCVDDYLKSGTTEHQLLFDLLESLREKDRLEIDGEVVDTNDDYIESYCDDYGDDYQDEYDQDLLEDNEPFPESAND